MHAIQQHHHLVDDDERDGIHRCPPPLLLSESLLNALIGNSIARFYFKWTRMLSLWHITVGGDDDDASSSSRIRWLFDGAMTLRSWRRDSHQLERLNGFHLSHWSTQSAGYSPHTAPAAAMVMFDDAKKLQCAKLLSSLLRRIGFSPSHRELRGRCKQRS